MGKLENQIRYLEQEFRPGRAKDISGVRFGRAVAVKPAGKDKHGAVIWDCLCDCGNLFTARMRALTTGRQRSCGCLRNEVADTFCKKHGYASSPEYKAYHQAKQRCQNQKCPRFMDWGGRGIRFLFTSFSEFLKDIGPRPGAGYSLDRIENDGNYAPGNVRWATRSEQQLNKRGVAW
jgi:hypothetical protein